MRKNFIVFCAFLFSFFLPSQVSAQAQSQIIILNQVRGSECCENGSVDAVYAQLQAIQENQLPATFVLRYDALKDTAYTNILQPSPILDIGVFFEITPSLTADAGVEYRGAQEQWYLARYTYLVGYSLEERKKIIDTVMRLFYQVYGMYPKATAAWMIDAWSLRYLVEKYGVVAHEITRDQWGTDSYTLYGGPMGMMYSPSKRWAMIPMQGPQALPVKIFRQTLPDPFWNYGDTTSSTTSQPNDYALAGKDISYFKNLVRQSLFQQITPQTIVLGLENSMDMHFQQEFAQQLSFLSSIRKEYENIFTVKTMRAASQETPPTIGITYGKRDINAKDASDGEVWWVTTPTYRARFLRKSDAFLLTDLRMYDELLVDPYEREALTTSHGYWIVPFAIDGSRIRTQEEVVQVPRNWFEKLMLSLRGKNFRVTSDTSDVFPDVRAMPLALRFPNVQGNIQIEKTLEGYRLFYTSLDGEVSLYLGNEGITYVGKRNPAWSDEQKRPLVPLDVEIVQTQTPMGIRITLKHTTHQISPWTLPEKNTSPMNMSTSFAYIHNIVSRFGRNPIRIVVGVRDAYGRVTQLHRDPEVQCNGGACGWKHITFDSSKGMYFFDVYPQKPGIVRLSLTLDDQGIVLGKAWSTYDCSRQKLYCMLFPHDGLGYVVNALFDRLQHDP